MTVPGLPGNAQSTQLTPQEKNRLFLAPLHLGDDCYVTAPVVGAPTIILMTAYLRDKYDNNGAQASVFLTVKGCKKLNPGTKVNIESVSNEDYWRVRILEGSAKGLSLFVNRSALKKLNLELLENESHGERKERLNDFNRQINSERVQGFTEAPKPASWGNPAYRRWFAGHMMGFSLVEATKLMDQCSDGGDRERNVSVIYCERLRASDVKEIRNLAVNLGPDHGSYPYLVTYLQGKGINPFEQIALSKLIDYLNVLPESDSWNAQYIEELARRAKAMQPEEISKIIEELRPHSRAAESMRYWLSQRSKF